MNTLCNEVNNDGPHSVNAGITVTTNGENSDQRICEVVEVTQDFIAGVQPGEIDGVESITYVGHDVEGGMCSVPVETVLSPINELLMLETPKKSLLSSIIWPLVAALVAAALFVGPRRHLARVKEEPLEAAGPDDFAKEDIQRRGLFGIDGYEEDMHYRGGDKPDHLNSLDVHKCTSLQCKICALSISPAFLPVSRSDSHLLRELKGISSESPNNVSPCKPVTEMDNIFKFEDSNSKADTLDSISLT